MLCSFLLYSKVNQLYAYIYPIPFHLDHHRALKAFPVLHRQFSLVICPIPSINRVYMSIPLSQFIPSPFSPFDIYVLVLYVCISIISWMLISCMNYFLGARYYSRFFKWLSSISLHVPENVSMSLFHRWGNWETQGCCLGSHGDIPGDLVVKNLPANAGDMSLIPHPRRSHMPWSN